MKKLILALCSLSLFVVLAGCHHTPKETTDELSKEISEPLYNKSQTY